MSVDLKQVQKGPVFCQVSCNPGINLVDLGLLPFK